MQKSQYHKNLTNLRSRRELITNRLELVKEKIRESTGLPPSREFAALEQERNHLQLQLDIVNRDITELNRHFSAG